MGEMVLLFGRTFWNVRFPVAEKPSEGAGRGRRVFSIYAVKQRGIQE